MGEVILRRANVVTKNGVTVLVTTGCGWSTGSRRYIASSVAIGVGEQVSNGAGESGTYGLPGLALPRRSPVGGLAG